MITCCKNFIKQETDNLKYFWNYKNVENLIKVFLECIELNDEYKKTFKNYDADMNDCHKRTFDLNDDEITGIFSLFDSFKRKLNKLIEVFLIKKQINILNNYDIDGKNIDELEK